MKTYQLLTDLTAAADGAEIRVQTDNLSLSRDECAVQVSIAGGTATVKLEGRISRGMAWVQLGSDITSSALVPIARLPFLRARATEISGATVNAAVFA